MRLTCQDAANPSDSNSATINVTVVSADTLRRKVNSAIDNGLRYSYLQQDTTSGCFNGYYGYFMAATGLALVAYENQGHNLDSPDADIYKPVVKQGLQCLFDNAADQALSDQPCIGDPEAPYDTQYNNHNNLGLELSDNGLQYSSGITLLAIVNASSLSTARSTVVHTTNPKTTLVDGNTLYGIAVEAKDYLAWSQTDGGPTGGGSTSAYCYDYNLPNPGSNYVQGSGALSWFFEGITYLPDWGDLTRTCDVTPGLWGIDYGDGSPPETVMGACYPGYLTYSQFGYFPSVGSATSAQIKAAGLDMAAAPLSGPNLPNDRYPI